MGAGELGCRQAAGKAEAPEQSSAQRNNFPIIGFQRAHGTTQAGRVLGRSPSQPLLKAGQAVTRLLRVFILPHLENL